jgi:hypothetical protein
MATSSAPRAVPWPFLRSLLARRWGVLPGAIDAAPWADVGVELALMELEGQAAHARQRGS